MTNFEHMVKSKHFLISFLLISTFTIGLSSNTYATQYTIGISTGTEHTLAIIKLDESTITREFMAKWMDLFLQFGFDFIKEEQIVYGARMKWEVLSINESATDGSYTGWGIDFAVWDWSTAPPAEHDDSQYLFVNDDPSNEVNAFLCAKPVSEYIGETTTGSDNDLEDTTVTREIDYLTYTFTFVYTWDSDTGFLSNFKIIYLGATVLEIGIPWLFFGYEIPIILGITAIVVVGVVIIILLRRKFKSGKRD